MAFAPDHETSGFGYVVGWTKASADSCSSTEETRNVLVSKWSFDMNGTPTAENEWEKVLGGPAEDEATAVTVASTGEVYVTTVMFEGPRDSVGYQHDYRLCPDGAVGSEANEHTWFGGQTTDAFLTKWSSSGNIEWARRIGGQAGELSHQITLPRDVTVDGNGNIIVVGFLYANGAPFYGQTAHNKAWGMAFFVKFAPTGEWLQARLLSQQPSTELTHSSASSVLLLGNIPVVVGSSLPPGGGPRRSVIWRINSCEEGTYWNDGACVQCGIGTWCPQDSAYPSTCPASFTCSTQTPRPQLQCPPNIELVDVCEETAVHWTAPTIPRCAASTSLSSAYLSGSLFEPGDYNVEYTLEGALPCYFAIQIRGTAAPPTFAGCPQTVVSECPGPVSWNIPSAEDACGNSLTVTSDATPPLWFETGVHTIQYQATDGVGNVATCEITVVVDDTTAPSFGESCQDVYRLTGSNMCTATLPEQQPSATDNCNGVTTTRTPSDQFFGPGTHAIVYNAVDGSGNQATSCNIHFVVEDKTPPSFPWCPAVITVQTPADSCGAVMPEQQPSASDNCNVTTTRTPSEQEKGFFEPGTHAIAYNAVDDSGNQATLCNIHFVVEDKTPPFFHQCPENMVIWSRSAQIGVEYTVGASDNCPEALSVTLVGPASGDAFPAEETTQVQWTATDGVSSVHCAFSVTVILDTDGDGVRDTEDNCVTVPNPDQTEHQSGVGEACHSCGVMCVNYVELVMNVTWEDEGYTAAMEACTSSCGHCYKACPKACKEQGLRGKEMALCIDKCHNDCLSASVLPWALGGLALAVLPVVCFFKCKQRRPKQMQEGNTEETPKVNVEIESVAGGHSVEAEM